MTKTARSSITPKTEAELQNLINQLFESESGVILYRCSSSRADYLMRMMDSLRYESAIESTYIANLRDTPIYGFGSYWNVKTRPSDEGLYLMRTDKPQMTPKQILIIVAFTGKTYTVHCADPDAAQSAKRQYERRLAKYRNQKRYIEWNSVHVYQNPSVPTTLQIVNVGNLDKAVIEIPRNAIEAILAQRNGPKAPTEDPELNEFDE
jgi:hypothetical protein